MTTSLYWQSFGQGPDVILLHGWGMNGAVWQQTAERLARCFCVHVVDLPGYGHSRQVKAQNLESISKIIVQEAPKKAIWVGWSLGGLVATHVALNHSKRVTKLVTVASSPRFFAEKSWRGIQPQVLALFTEQLVEDFQLTVERFMGLQAMGSPSARQDVRQLKQAVLSRPLPDPKALLAGLDMLANVDLRANLTKITVPYLRTYGRLDGLVPIKVAKDMEEFAPNSHQYTFEHSSHAPFMTELDEFCEKITNFCK